ncbi:cation diffusion facilitator family transporter [Methylocaldum sp.]|uniref:cation diffusion facilitator family transporter n=1 Tax=Methylocaldum sp. TaxID=1969727 RepID=UPI002D4F7358|nr:cation diffusion facilitator family transporter [Methylocaldum sp.]HYE34747.1 cation diffusion facilitator family transporter [Methylocaldum sp.]
MAGGHTHVHVDAAGSRTKFRLGLSIVLTVAFVVFEALAGLIANSLALLTDAAHNLTDVVALVLSWYALHLAEQPSHAGKTFGYHRVGILVALINSTTLTLIAAGIFYEAYQRFISPPPVAVDILIAVGAAAFVINLVTAWLVSHGSEHDLNLRSVFIHLLGDVFSTAGAVFAGIGIWLTGLYWLDPLASVLIGLLILWNAWIILRETIDILLESTPRDIEMSSMVRDLLQIEGVKGVHDLHVWSISKSFRLLSAHIVIDDVLVSQAALIQHEIKEMIIGHYGIGHCTLQLECEGCDPDSLYCDINHHDRHRRADNHRAVR